MWESSPKYNASDRVSPPAASPPSSSKLTLNSLHDTSTHDDDDDEDGDQDSFLGRWESDEGDQSWEASAAGADPLPVVPPKQYVFKPRQSLTSSTSSSTSTNDEKAGIAQSGPSTPRTSSAEQAAGWQAAPGSSSAIEAPPTPARIQGILRLPATPGTGRSVRFGLRLYDDGDQSRLSASTAAEDSTSRDSSRSAASTIRDRSLLSEFDDATLERLRMAQDQLQEDESMQAVEKSLHSDRWESGGLASTSRVSDEGQAQAQPSQDGQLQGEDEEQEDEDESSSPDRSMDHQRTATSSPTLRVSPVRARVTSPLSKAAAPPSPPSGLTAVISTTDVSDLLDTSLPSNLDENETAWNLLPLGKQSPRSAPASRSAPNTMRAEKTSTGSMVSSASIDSANLSFSESFLKREMARAMNGFNSSSPSTQRTAPAVAAPSGHFASTTVSQQAPRASPPALSPALDESETLAQQTLPGSETALPESSTMLPSSPTVGDQSNASTSAWATPAGSIATSRAGTTERINTPLEAKRMVTPRSSASPASKEEYEDSPSAARAARRAPVPSRTEGPQSPPASIASAPSSSPVRENIVALAMPDAQHADRGLFASILARLRSSTPADAMDMMLAQVNELDATHEERADLLRERAREAEEAAERLRATLAEERAFRQRAEVAAQNSIRKLVVERTESAARYERIEEMLRIVYRDLEKEGTPAEQVEQLKRQLDVERRERASEQRDMEVRLHMAERQQARNASPSPTPSDALPSDVQAALTAARTETREACERDAEVRVYALQVAHDRRIDELEAQLEHVQAEARQDQMELMREREETHEEVTLKMEVLEKKLIDEREAATVQIKELEGKLSEQQSKQQSLVGQLDAARDERAASAERIAKLERAEVASQRAEAELKSQAVRLAELSAALIQAKELNPYAEDVTALRLSMERTQAEHENELDDLHRQLAELEEQHENGQLTVDRAQQALNNSKATESELGTALSDAQEEVQKLQTQLKERDARIGAAESQVSQVRAEAEATAEEKARLESLLRGANVARQESDARCTDLASRLQDARVQQEAQRGDVLELQERVHKSEQTLESTKRELTSAQSALSTAKSKASTESNELIAELERQIEDAAAELEAEQKRGGEAIALAEEMQSRLDALEAKFEALRERAAMLERENADRGLTIAKLTKVKERLESDSQNYSIALSAKQQELSLLKRSRTSTTPKVAGPVTPAAEPRSVPIARRLSVHAALAPPPTRTPTTAAAAKESNTSASSATSGVMGPPTARPTARRQSMAVSNASGTASRPAVSAPRRSMLASSSTRETTTPSDSRAASTRTPLTARRLSVSSTGSARSSSSVGTATPTDAKRISTNTSASMMRVSMRSENDTPMDLSELKSSASSAVRTSARRVSVAPTTNAATDKENSAQAARSLAASASASAAERREASLRALPRAPGRTPTPTSTTTTTTAASAKLSSVRGMDSFLERRQAIARQRASMTPTPS